MVLLLLMAWGGISFAQLVPSVINEALSPWLAIILLCSASVLLVFTLVIFQTHKSSYKFFTGVVALIVGSLTLVVYLQYQQNNLSALIALSGYVTFFIISSVLFFYNIKQAFNSNSQLNKNKESKENSTAQTQLNWLMYYCPALLILLIMPLLVLSNLTDQLRLANFVLPEYIIPEFTIPELVLAKLALIFDTQANTEIYFISSEISLFLVSWLFQLSFLALALAVKKQQNTSNVQDEQKELSANNIIGSEVLLQHLGIASLRQTSVQRKTSATNKQSLLLIQVANSNQLHLYFSANEINSLYQSYARLLNQLLADNKQVISLTNSHDVHNNLHKVAFIEPYYFTLLVENADQEALRQLSEHVQLQLLHSQTLQAQQEQTFNTSTSNLAATAHVMVIDNIDDQLSLIEIQSLAQQNFAQAKLNKQGYFYLARAVNNEQKHQLQLLAKDLQQAIENNHFEIYHQAQVDLKTLRVCSSECLLRWTHAEFGLIPVKQIITLAKDFGFINQLSLAVIKQALTQQFEIKTNLKYKHMVSINLCHDNIVSDEFFKQVLPIIEASEITADKIIFELTEPTTLSSNALANIEKFTELGITFSINQLELNDESLAGEQSLPFQEFKINRRFVEAINDKTNLKLLSQATIKVAKGLGLEVVAEGINSQADEDCMRRFGCDIGQGYFYAKPLAFKDYLNWLEKLENGRIPKPVEGEYIPADK